MLRLRLPYLMLAAVLALPFALVNGMVPGASPPGDYAVGLRPGQPPGEALRLAALPGWRVDRLALVGPFQVLILRAPAGTMLPAGLRARSLFTLSLPAVSACLPARRRV